MGSDSNHKICQAISGISLPLGFDKLYSGSADGSVRIWDCNSGKVAWFSAHSNVSDYARAPTFSDYARAPNNLSDYARVMVCFHGGSSEEVFIVRGG